MNKPTLLILSIGELGTNLLETISRTNIFERIIVGSRNKLKAVERANNALIGSGIEGYFTDIVGEEFNTNSSTFSKKLCQLDPDFIFTAPTLMPWWKINQHGLSLPFGGYCALHLSPMLELRDGISSANINDACWINGSFPDVINPVLTRTGFGPSCGIGNVQEPISKIQIGVAKKLECCPKDVEVQLVAQHAFEYYVLNDKFNNKLPPYLLKVVVNNKDVSDLGIEVLKQRFPFAYDLHFNRVTASAGLVAIKALTGTTPIDLHLPGISNLIGGYPAKASNKKININLPQEWPLKKAISTNEKSLRWDGIEQVDRNGNIFFTDETQKLFLKLSGSPLESLTLCNVKKQAKQILSAL